VAGGLRLGEDAKETGTGTMWWRERSYAPGGDDNMGSRLELRRAGRRCAAAAKKNGCQRSLAMVENMKKKSIP